MIGCCLCCIHQNLSRSVSFSGATSGPAHSSSVQASHLCNFSRPWEAPCFHGYHALKTNVSWYNSSSRDLHEWYPLRWSRHSQNVNLYPVNPIESKPNKSTFKTYNFNKRQKPMPPIQKFCPEYREMSEILRSLLKNSSAADFSWIGLRFRKKWQELC